MPLWSVHQKLEQKPKLITTNVPIEFSSHKSFTEVIIFNISDDETKSGSVEGETKRENHLSNL